MSSKDSSDRCGSTQGAKPLSFPFRDRRVPVTYLSSVTPTEAQMAIQCEPFQTWYRRCERISYGIDESGDGNGDEGKRLELHSVIIQSVDFFGPRKVGFVKIISHCTLFDGKTHHESRLPGICFIRGNAVSIFVALFCEEPSGTKTYSLLVDQPRVPIGAASLVELPAGMLDDEAETVAGIAVKEMEEECGIKVRPSDLVDLTELALQQAVKNGNLPIAAIPPSPGGSDEFVRYMYLEKKVTPEELEEMKGRLAGLREHGEFITLKVVPMEDVWKISGDSKAMISLFLIDQLRREGKLPPAGSLATSLKGHQSSPPESIAVKVTHPEPKIKLSDGTKIPQLAYSMYKVPCDEIGEQAILDAIAAGYRHFDGAAFYQNEAVLGRALRKSGIQRQDFFIASKVWNDAVKGGRQSVRESVLQSLRDLDFGGYFDLYYVHWPVPGHFVEAYHELERLWEEGKIREIGLSNFNPTEYETLVESGITVPPVVNQFEVSPVMYRPDRIEFFQNRGVTVAAFKPLNRCTSFQHHPQIGQLAEKHSVTPPQIMLRWCLQKGLIVACKTVNADRMKENRSITHFCLDKEDMTILDSLTTDEDRQRREEHEMASKTKL